VCYNITNKIRNFKLPTLLNQNGFKFFFYANEHEPKHIHVMKNEGFAKIELANLNVVQNYLKAKDLKEALEIIKENKSEFERRWDEWFN
jgi:hypothetical protein